MSSGNVKMNRGEWTETYVVLRLSGEKKLYECDSALRPSKTNFCRLQKILLRAKEIANERTFDLRKDGNVVVIDANDKQMGIADDKDLIEISQILFSALKEPNQKKGEGAFPVPAVEKFLKEKLNSSAVKQSSGKKQDLMITFLDRGSGGSKELGFSIKSHVGANPTLINASGSTRFEYALSGKLPQKAVAEFNAKEGYADKMEILRSRGIDLVFKRCSNPVYERNLQTVDTQFPRVLAEMIKIYFRERIKLLSELSVKISESNPLRLNLSGKTPIYEMMIKRFLRQHTLGMNAASPWDGRQGVSGGCIIVKTDGEIVCFYAYNFDDLDEFLLHNAVFDTPASRKHAFGKIFEDPESGKQMVRLNFQVREDFKKRRRSA